MCFLMKCSQVSSFTQSDLTCLVLPRGRRLCGVQTEPLWKWWWRGWCQVLILFHQANNHITDSDLRVLMRHRQWQKHSFIILLESYLDLDFHWQATDQVTLGTDPWMHGRHVCSKTATQNWEYFGVQAERNISVLSRMTLVNHYYVNKSSLLDAILGQLNPDHTFTLNFFIICCIISLTSIPNTMTIYIYC
jgi:hypothetical protein